MRNVGISYLSMMVQNLLETLTKGRSQVFFKSIDLQFMTNAIGEGISAIRKWNIVNQLGKHDFSFS